MYCKTILKPKKWQNQQEGMKKKRQLVDLVFTQKPNLQKIKHLKTIVNHTEDKVDNILSINSFLMYKIH